MAAETELERLVVRLVGDVRGYEASLAQAQQATVKTADQIAAVQFAPGSAERGLGSIEEMVAGLERQAAASKLSAGESQRLAVAERFAADNNVSLQQALAKLAPQLERMKAAQDKLASGFETAGLKGRDLRKGLSLLGSTAILPPSAAHGVWMAVEAMETAKRAVGGLASSGSLLKGAFMGVGVGAAATAIGIGVDMLSKWSENLDKAREKAKGAFMQTVQGARTASQAMSDVSVEAITSGLEDVAGAMNPGFWRMRWDWWSSLFTGTGPVEAALGRVVDRVEESRASLARLQSDPRVQRLQREAAVERGTQASRDAAQALEEEAARTGMAEREAKRYAEAQQLARQATIPLTEALNMLAASHERQRTAEATADIGRMSLQLRELTDEADRAGQTDVQQRVTSMAQEFLRANPAVGTLQSAFEQLNPILTQTRDQLNRINLGNFRRGLRDQANTMGLTSERAELFRMAMDGVSEANLNAASAEVRQLEALRALQQPLERIEGTRAFSAEAVARIAEYERQLSAAATTASTREGLLAQQRQVQTAAQPQAQLSVGAAAQTAAQQALTVQQIQQQAGSFQTIVQQAQPAAASAPAPFTAAQPAPAQAAPQSQAPVTVQSVGFGGSEGILRDIRDILSAIRTAVGGQAAQGGQQTAPLPAGVS
jgi:hypothetical protein